MWPEQSADRRPPKPKSPRTSLGLACPALHQTSQWSHSSSHSISDPQSSDLMTPCLSPHPPLKPLNLFQQFLLGFLSCVPESRVHAEISAPLSLEAPACSLSCRHMGKGCSKPLPPSAPALPRGPWETSSHAGGHQNSSLGLTHGPCEVVPRKHCAHKWFSELGAFRSGHFVRPKQLATSQEPSRVFHFSIFLLIGILFARRARGLQDRSQSRTAKGSPSFVHQTCGLILADRQNLFPKCPGDGGRFCGGLNK